MPLPEAGIITWNYLRPRAEHKLANEKGYYYCCKAVSCSVVYYRFIMFVLSRQTCPSGRTTTCEGLAWRCIPSVSRRRSLAWHLLRQLS